jgi:acylphosphatase
LKLRLNGLACLKTKNNLVAKIKVHIFGKVQGVFFRHSARQQALALSLTGWIKNLPDGSVLCEAQGEKKWLLEFIAWCNRGPQRAEVENVTVEWSEDQSSPEATDFEIVN